MKYEKKKNSSFINFHLSSFNFHLSTSFGFTLIEIVVVFSIMMIVTGVGYASFSAYTKSQELTQAAGDVKQAFENSKFNAISFVKKNNCTGAGNTLLGFKTVVCAEAPCVAPAATASHYEIDVICSSGTTNLTLLKLPRNITFDTVGTTCGEVRYDTLSNSIVGSPCTVILTGYGMTKTINIDAGGNVSIN